MAEYRIRIWDEATIVKDRESWRRSRPGAMRALRKAVYDVLAAFRKLDTEAAHIAMSKVDEMNDTMPVGTQKSLMVGDTGKRCTIERVG